MALIERTLKVLIIEDSKNDYSKLLYELKRVNGKVHLIRVNCLEEIKIQLQNRSWDLVISDYKLNNFTANEALKMVQDETPEVPFVLLSCGLGEEVVADMINAGVEDVVLWNKLERLHPIVKRIIRTKENRAREARANKMASEAFAAKEQMLAIVSHDIKNPISAIQLEAQMLLRASDRSPNSLLPDEVKIQANRILKTTERMKFLISDLLDKNKSENCLGNLSKEDTHVAKIIHDVVENVRPIFDDKKIRVDVSIPDGISILMDKNKIFQVLSNLLSNAIKFSPTGGIIKLRLQENENEHLFSIEDSGSGLNDKELNWVFEKYWTGNSSHLNGTGLGLFICKTIVEAHGGRIFAENHPDCGAIFKFSIPKYFSDNKQNFSYREEVHDERKKIIVIDDDEDLREVMTWALNKEGYSIFPFGSPIEALRTLIEGNLSPDLMIVDFHLQEMNGNDFVQEKNSIDRIKYCPVLMISASPQDVENSLPADLYTQVLTKPIDLEGLVINVKNNITN